MKNTGESENIKDVKQDNPKQSQKFVETAERLESDKSSKPFNKAIKKIIKNR